MKRVLLLLASLAAFWTASVATAFVLIQPSRFTAGGGSAPTLIASVGTVAGVSGATSSGINTTGANLIVINVGYYATASGLTVTDSNSNTWTPLTANTGTATYQRFYYCYNPTVGSGHTFTVSGTTIYATFQVMAFDAVAASPFDTEVGNSAGGGWSSLSTGSLTPGQNNVLLVAGIGFGGTNAGTGMAPDSSFLGTVVNGWVSGGHQGGAIAYKVISNGAAHNVTWAPGETISEGGAALASFKY